MSNGPLTQTINAAKTTADRILSLPNLPPEADALKGTAAEFNAQLCPMLLDMQSRVLATSASATKALTGVQAKLIESQGKPDAATRAEITRTLATAQSDLRELNPIIAAANKATDDYYEKVTANSRTLSALAATLAAQRSGLQGQLETAQAEVESVKDKMKYYALLGLAGLPGLIAMGVLLSQANDKVNDISGKIRTLDEQIRQTDQTLLAVNAMLTDFQNLSASTLPVKNAAEFVLADVGHALSAVEHAGDSDTISVVYVTTALNELQILTNDAS